MATIIKINQDNRAAVFKEAYEGSYYTITGCGGDINEWVKGYNNELSKRGIGRIDKFYLFYGRDMHANYGLSGNNAYPDELTFLMFANDGLVIPKLAMFKYAMQDRWFDDIVDNNARAQEEIFTF